MLLYELSILEMQILEKLYSEDGIDKDVYDQLKLDEEEKIVRCAKLYRQLVSDMQACKEEANRLAERKRKLEKSAERLRSHILDGMKLTNTKKICRPEFDISVRTNPPSLYIDDDNEIPAEYFTTPAPVLDKTALKDAVKNGTEIKGVWLLQTERVDIK